MSKDKSEPMDAGAQETSRPVEATNAFRVAHGLKTLVAEVRALFPETPVEYSGVDGRNTALAVTFDLTALPDAHDVTAFTALLMTTMVDHRVAEVFNTADQVYVRLHSNAILQDSRESFDLDAIWLMMDEEQIAGKVVESFGTVSPVSDETINGGTAEATTSDILDGGTL